MEPEVVRLLNDWILRKISQKNFLGKDEQKKRESKILLHKKQYKFYPDSVWAQAKKYKMFYAYDHSM